NGNSIPPALKDVKPADGVCRKEDFTSAAAQDVFGMLKPDLGCSMSAGDVGARLSDPRLAVMDLRHASEYEKFHIENALSVDLVALLSKPYWRNKSVLLVGDGKFDHDIYLSCTRLKQAGYKQVHVLSGGMLAWLEQNMPVVGRPLSLQQQAHLNDYEFWRITRNEGVLVLLDKTITGFQQEFPQALVLPQITPEALRSILDKKRKMLKGQRFVSVVLVLRSELGDESLRILQQAVAPESLLVYAQGLDLYKKQVSTQKAVWAAHAKGPKQLGCGL
ncbi:MAG: rhodanese-like domain-containing protein, partial [Rhodocyclales bacterium]|nr:rhodanese-like domain-containing protein [Rhodocyclales bacterium]